MLSKRENWLLVGWVCMEIDYSLAEHARKLVTLWLSISGNWLLVGWAYAEIHFYCFIGIEPCFYPVIHSTVPFSRPLSPVSSVNSHSLFPVSRLCSFYPILYSLSNFFVSCLPSSVPFITSLFLVSRPLFPVSLLCSLFPALCSLSHVSVPCIPSTLSCITSCSLSLVLCSQSLTFFNFWCPSWHSFYLFCYFSVYSIDTIFIRGDGLTRCCCAGKNLPLDFPGLNQGRDAGRDSNPGLPYSSPARCTNHIATPHPILRLCSLSPVLFSQSSVSVPFITSSFLGNFSIILVPYAQDAMKSFPSMLSVRWNRFCVCSAWDEIHSAYSQHAMKSFPCMLSMR